MVYLPGVWSRGSRPRLFGMAPVSMSRIVSMGKSARYVRVISLAPRVRESLLQPAPSWEFQGTEPPRFDAPA